MKNVVADLTKNFVLASIAWAGTDSTKMMLAAIIVASNFLSIECSRFYR